MVPQPHGEGAGGSEEGVRQRLQSELLAAVRDCQSRFGGRRELATELDAHVRVLLASLERVFAHGLCAPRTGSSNSAIRQVTEKVLGTSVGSSGSFSGESTASFWPIVREHLTAHERDRYTHLRHVWTDGGRARAWLRSAINEHSLERTVLALLASELIAEHYEPWAFLRDQERNSILPTTAAGLGSILFAISIDKPELNHCSSSNLASNSSMPHAEPVIPPPVNVPGAKRSDGRRKKKISPNIISFDDDDDFEVTSTSPTVQPVLPPPTNDANQAITIGVDCLESESTADIDSGIADSENELQSVGLRPVTNSSVGELIPVALSEETHSSEDSLSVPSFSEDNECTGIVEEVAAVVLVSGGEESNYADDGDETSLEQQLQTERGLCAALRAQLSECQKRLQDTDTTINTLNRENELLKHQLRKYVMAVQSIEQDERASLFEQKLVQVAEMHGELMEMNERLQRSLVAKESLIERLRAELEGVRGPLPSALSSSTSSSASSLVSLWLPSVFLSGDTDSHHVYQVHVRICSEEWNVYRRYAQFYALHKQLKKQYPIVSTFNFPPKKTIGNKEARFVEQRRDGLQQYLRKVVDQLVQTQPELATHPSKPLLISLLPFFGELTCMEDKQKKGSKAPRQTYAADSPHYTGL
ncbi:sorting nexin-29 isoform X2 [Nilaparvata lugens]|nr:sorting nexin-29 isoform X2 [Nilaparvata lugens]